MDSGWLVRSQTKPTVRAVPVGRIRHDIFMSIACVRAYNFGVGKRRRREAGGRRDIVAEQASRLLSAEDGAAHDRIADVPVDE